MVVCVQLSAKDNCSVDLDVLQAGINVSGHDKFLRDVYVARERDKGKSEREERKRERWKA